MSPAPRLQSDQEYMKWYQDLETKFLALGDAVHYHGFMNAEDITYAYSAADRVLFPYSRRLAASGPMALAIGYEKDIALSSILKGEKEFHFDFDDLKKAGKLKKERTWEKIAEKTAQVYAK